MENNKNKKSVKFQGDMLNFCDFIQVFVFTPNHHLNNNRFIVGYNIQRFFFQTVITYNAGLYTAIGLGVVPNPPSREARRDAIIAELNNPANDADCACIQEVSLNE